MSTLLDIMAGVRDILEPSDAATKDETGARPLEHKEEVLYLYPDPGRCREVPFETGPTARQEFVLIAEYLAPSSEEALRKRDVTVSGLLDEKRGQYMAAVRNNRVTVTWHHLQAAEQPPSRKLMGRGIAIAISGYRIV